MKHQLDVVEIRLKKVYHTCRMNREDDWTETLRSDPAGRRKRSIEEVQGQEVS